MSPPIGTPESYALSIISGAAQRFSSISQPAKNLGLILGPEVPKTSFRNSASKIESLVFSSAQTPAKPPGFPSIPLVRMPFSNLSNEVPSPTTAPTHEDSLTLPALETWVSVDPITPSLIGLNPVVCSSFSPTSKADLWKSVGSTQPAPSIPLSPTTPFSHSFVI